MPILELAPALMALPRVSARTICGAKLACLHAAGKLKPGQPWWQASILDTVFHRNIAESPTGEITPHIFGHAWVNGEATCFLNRADSFRFGIRTPN
jgi:proline racemase